MFNCSPILLYGYKIGTLNMAIIQPQSTHRVATAAFWRTFYHDGIISLSLVRVAGARPPSFPIFTITYKVAMFDPAEWAYTLTLFHLYQYMYSVDHTLGLNSLLYSLVAT